METKVAENTNIVTTVSGKIAKRTDCRRIRGEFYKIGDHTVKNSGECYLIKSKETGKESYIRQDSDLIEYNHTIGEYVRVKEYPNLIFGYINSNYVKGYFEEDLLNNINASNYRAYRSESRSYDGELPTMSQKGFYYSNADGRWYSTDESLDYRVNGFIRASYKGIQENYGAVGNTMFNTVLETKDQYEKQLVYSNIDAFNKFLFGYSLGLEFETSLGKISKRDMYRYGLLPLKDGSITGFEYTTIPYFDSPKRLSQISEMCDVLTENTEVDNRCSFHVHFGNTRTDRDFIVSLYVLLYNLQDELFELNLPYKTSSEHVANSSSKKNYCKKFNLLMIDDIDFSDYKKGRNEAYNKIFKFLNENNSASQEYNRKNKKHIREGQNKWNYKNRYFFVNFMNMFFSNNSTVEFRLSDPTTNRYKVLYNLFIFSAILKYAENNIRKIISRKEKITLKDVIDSVYSEIGTQQAEELKDNVNKYINEQRLRHFNLFNSGSFGYNELRKDSSFVPEDDIFFNVKQPTEVKKAKTVDFKVSKITPNFVHFVEGDKVRKVTYSEYIESLRKKEPVKVNKKKYSNYYGTSVQTERERIRRAAEALSTQREVYLSVNVDNLNNFIANTPDLAPSSHFDIEELNDAVSSNNSEY